MEKEIYRFHLELWENQLYPILKELRKSKKQFAEAHIIKMYKNIEKMQKPYLRYLQNASEAIDYGMELQKTTPSFQKYCNWCERKGLKIRMVTDSTKILVQDITSWSVLHRRYSTNTIHSPLRPSIRRKF